MYLWSNNASLNSNGIMKNSDDKRPFSYTEFVVFAQTSSNFICMKTLRTIHEFCMVNLSYHNEYVKIFSMQTFTAVMGNQGNKGTPLFYFFHFVPSLAQDISQTFWYFAIKFSKVEDNCISNNSSEYEWNYQEIKPWRGLKIFENL